MKKIFISISAAFIFMLSCIIPFTASAVYDNRETDVNSLVAHYKSDFLDDAAGYIFFNFDIQNPNVTTACVIKFTSQNLQDGTFNYASNILTISYPSSIFQYFGINTYLNSYISTYVNTIVFDFNNNTGYLMENNDKINFNLNSDAENFHFYNFDTNLDVMREPIEVELFPELCENFDYKGEYDGFSMELTQLQVDITNNTNNNYEYAILVQPKNAEMNVGLPNNSENNTFFWGSSPVTYALVKDEWIQRDAADAISAAFNALGYNPYVGDVSAPITINTPSAWHYLPHNDTKREWIYYEQMQLKRGVDYTFKVYVYNITQNAPNNYSDQLVYPAYNNLELVYTKDFSVVKDTKFDVDSVSNGAYSFDNTATLGSQFDKIKALQEQDGNIKIFDNNNSSASGASGRVGSNSSYNNLISNSSSFLSLLKNVFNYLPDYVSMLLFGGLLCMVLVAIWRKL